MQINKEALPQKRILQTGNKDENEEMEKYDNEAAKPSFEKGG